MPAAPDAPDKPVALHILVFGRVQGVGFRSWAAREASRLALAGWVRNLPDGSVEVLAEGKPERLDRFCDSLQNGNGYSITEDIKINRVSPSGYTRFFIE